MVTIYFIIFLDIFLYCCSQGEHLFFIFKLNKSINNKSIIFGTTILINSIIYYGQFIKSSNSNRKES